MDKYIFSILAAGLAILAFCMAGGSQPAPAQHPERLASLAPAITETLYALGLGDRLAGVTSFCKHPPEAGTKPAIGGFREVNLEAIARIDADLVILPEDMGHFREAIENLGIQVLPFDYGSVPAYLASVEALGRVCKAGIPARQLINEFRDVIAQNSPDSRPGILFVVLNPDEFHKPLSEMTIVGADKFYNDVIAAAGGRNVYSGNIPFPRISLEAAFALNPDVIAIAAPGLKNINSIAKSWQEFCNWRGSQNARFALLSERGDTIPGPSALGTIRKLAKAIQTAQEAANASAN